MNTQSIARLQFDFNFAKHRLSQFRGAIVELIGREAEAFHNHDNYTAHKKFHFEYPVIQYRIQNGKPCITAFQAGIPLLYNCLLPQLRKTPSLRIGTEDYSLDNLQLEEKRFAPQLNVQAQPYTLNHWLALNRSNFLAYQSRAKDRFAQNLILNRALTGHLKSMYRMLAPEISQERIAAQVLEVQDIRRISWRKIPLLSFRVDFASNVSLSPDLSLGRMAAFGFGELEQEAMRRNMSLAKVL